jgi:formylmethanofuran dehydrogenase subunit E
LTGGKYDNSPWNVVHLLHEVHVEAHNFLKEAMPNEKGAIIAVNGLKSGCPRLAAQERWENPEYIKKQDEANNNGTKSKKLRESQAKRYEDQNERLKASETQKNRPRIKCEYCGEEFSPGMYKRWHGEKCPKNPNRIA